MSIKTAYVSLPTIEASERIKSQLSADLVHEEYHSMGEKSVSILIFEKYYLRTSSSVGLTVTLSGDGIVPTLVTAVASAGGTGMFNINWGANSNFCEQVINILRQYMV